MDEIAHIGIYPPILVDLPKKGGVTVIIKFRLGKLLIGIRVRGHGDEARPSETFVIQGPIELPGEPPFMARLKIMVLVIAV